QAIIYKDTVQIVANSSVNQRCCDGRVYPTAERHHNFFITESFFERSYRFIYICCSGPVLRTTADSHYKVFDPLAPLTTVGYFRLKFNTIYRLDKTRKSIRRYRVALCSGQNGSSFG